MHNHMNNDAVNMHNLCVFDAHFSDEVSGVIPCDGNQCKNKQPLATFFRNRLNYLGNYIIIYVYFI